MYQNEKFNTDPLFADMKSVPSTENRVFVISSQNEIDLMNKSFMIFRTVITTKHACSILHESKTSIRALCWKNQNLCSFLEDLLKIRMIRNPCDPVCPQSGDTVIMFDMNYFHFVLLSFTEMTYPKEQKRLTAEEVDSYPEDLTFEELLKLQNSTETF